MTEPRIAILDSREKTNPVNLGNFYLDPATGYVYVAARDASSNWYLVNIQPEEDSIHRTTWEIQSEFEEVYFVSGTFRKVF